jgi:hypothetical protein
MNMVVFSTQQQKVTVEIICNIEALIHDIALINFIHFCCQIEYVAHIVHRTPMFARLQCPRVWQVVEIEG